MRVHILGIDLAKNVFQLHGVDERGHVVLTKRVPRGRLREVVAQVPPCVIGLEACRGAHHWGTNGEGFIFVLRISWLELGLVSWSAVE
jgi:transposase